MTTIFIITNLLQCTLRRVLQLLKKDSLGFFFLYPNRKLHQYVRQTYLFKQIEKSNK